MRTASNVISWISGIATTIFSTILCVKWQNFLYRSGYASFWVWIIFSFALLFRLIILVVRGSMIDSGNKAGAGILTLLFVSFLGGIFTFCIPDSETYCYSPHHGYTHPNSPLKLDEGGVLTPEEAKIEKDKAFELFSKSQISKEEYMRRIRDINLRTPSN